MSPTEVALLATFKSPVIRLETICETYLGVGYERAKQLAALNRLPLHTFKLHDSERAPYLVASKDLADYIDRARAASQASWERAQV